MFDGSLEYIGFFWRSGKMCMRIYLLHWNTTPCWKHPGAHMILIEYTVYSSLFLDSICQMYCAMCVYPLYSPVA